MSTTARSMIAIKTVPFRGTNQSNVRTENQKPCGRKGLTEFASFAYTTREIPGVRKGGFLGEAA
jgi:hypothetical protein